MKLNKTFVLALINVLVFIAGIFLFVSAISFIDVAATSTGAVDLDIYYHLYWVVGLLFSLLLISVSVFNLISLRYRRLFKELLTVAVPLIVYFFYSFLTSLIVIEMYNKLNAASSGTLNISSNIIATLIFSILVVLCFGSAMIIKMAIKRVPSLVSTILVGCGLLFSLISFVFMLNRVLEGVELWLTITLLVTTLLVGVFYFSDYITLPPNEEKEKSVPSEPEE